MTFAAYLSRLGLRGTGFFSGETPHGLCTEGESARDHMGTALVLVVFDHCCWLPALFLARMLSRANLKANASRFKGRENCESVEHVACAQDHLQVPRITTLVARTAKAEQL